MSRLIKTLIVEDEPAIARGLESVIMKYMTGFEVVGICANGQQGLEEIAEKQPDLVFTDIRMPVINGLEMIRKAKESDSGKRTYVILTGFEEFEYAKSALKLGVSDYLLKPLKIQEMQTFLSAFYTQFMESEHQQILKNLQSLLLDDPENCIQRNCFKGYAMTVVCLFYGCIFQPAFDLFSSGNEAAEHLNHDFIRSIEKEYGIQIYPLRGHHSNEYLYFILYPEELPARIHDILRVIDRNLCLQNDLYHNYIISETIHDPLRTKEVISNCYLFSALNTPFAENAVFLCKDINGAGTDLPSETIKSLCQSMPSSPPEEVILAFCKHCVLFWKEKSRSQHQLLTDIRFIQSSMIKKCRHDIFLNIPAAEILVSSDNYAVLEENLSIVIHGIFGISKEESALNRSLAVQVKEYLENNFTTKISGKTISQVFPYSEKYLTFLFKNEYDTTPSKYLTLLRMNYAKQLMTEHPEMPLWKIASTVGFEDSFYFSRVFKNTQGLSPSEFQKQQHT